MNRTAFVFPGQSTHYTGMGKAIAAAFPEADEIFEMACDVTGMDVRKLCFEGPDSELVKTENSQPAIHTTSIAVLAVLKRRYGLTCDVTAGFSLGQYAALVNAGALRFEDTVRLVRKRGMFMESAVPMGLGKMAALVGLPRAEVIRIVEEAGVLGHVAPTNFNCPGQIIVGGYAAPVERAVELALARGAAAANFLPVSGPFHTTLLTEAGNRLREELEKIAFARPQMDFVDNVTGRYLTPDDDLRELLRAHVYKPVAWEESVCAMLDRGVNVFVEIGPKALLTGFNTRCAKEKGMEAHCYHVEDVDTLEDLLRSLEKGKGSV